jgi:hypothetical protein
MVISPCFGCASHILVRVVATSLSIVQPIEGKSCFVLSPDETRAADDETIAAPDGPTRASAARARIAAVGG